MKTLDLSEEAFSRLLARLNADPILAGEEYEKLRARLIYFFERKGCRIPAELGSDTALRIFSWGRAQLFVDGLGKLG